MEYNPEYEKQWQEYLESIKDFDFEHCPHCKRIGDIFFRSGRIFEVLEGFKFKEEV